MTNQHPQQSLSPNLRYERIKPNALQFRDAEPSWAAPRASALENVIDAMLEEQWRVSHIRAELERLHIKPAGRSRQALTEQLMTAFLDPERLSASLSLLPENVVRCYFYLVLTLRMQSHYTTPASLDRICQMSVNAFNNQVLSVGLALYAESGHTFIPRQMVKFIPPGHLAFPVLPDPPDYVAAKPTGEFLLHIQHIMGLFDERTYTLRDRLRWNPPDQAYYRDIHCWPPHPDDARQLITDMSKGKNVRLWPAEPQLDDASLQQWSDNLDLPQTTVEFLYHILVQSGIIHAGSPLRINQTLVQQWLGLSPGRQIVILYNLYRSISSWAAWWSPWREEQVQIKWNFQGYWGLSYIDNAILSMAYNLRGTFLEILSFLPQNAWLSLDAVLDWMVEVFPNSSSHRFAQGTTITGLSGGWRGWLKLTLESVLCGPLHNLGFVDVAPSLEQVQAFRLRHLQEVHWGHVTEFDTGIDGTVQSSAVQVDPRAQVVKITTPVPPDLLSLVQLWAEPDGIKGRTLHYRLDVKRLHQAFENGKSPAELREAWHKCTGFAIPDTIQQWWEHWWQGYGHIRLYQPQTVLTTRDEFTMQELQMAIPDLTASIVSMVTPKAALIQVDSADKLLENLEQRGYMAKEES
ncbi:MAG: hypothetical protein P1S60_10825 [Anaerolineae bacterium]|nr:hypothetical protein [Anaerolineae bacterium]